MHLHLNVRPTLDVRLLQERGWGVVRRYHVLRRPLDPAGDRPVPPPSGVRVRACTAPADRARVHALYQAAFADHFDFQARELPSWLHDIDAGGLDWSLVWIVTTDDLGDAGFLIARDDRAAMGWIRSVGVLREARGHGLGGLLLRQAFAAFAARGGTPWGWAWTPRTPPGRPRSTPATG